MAESTNPVGNYDMKNTLQRPTSLTVSHFASPSIAATIKSDQIKTPSPSKNNSSSTIIQVPPSPSQNKITATSPTLLETSQNSGNAPAANSVSFLEMASSFFRWGDGVFIWSDFIVAAIW